VPPFVYGAFLQILLDWVIVSIGFIQNSLKQTGIYERFFCNPIL
jgi:hypothetical protein